jgi:uncharacterized protein (DUF58 family)
LTKGFKGLLIVLAILALLLGGISYVVLGLALLYTFFYGIAIRKGKATLKTDVNTYTIKQKDKLTFLYEMDVDFALPFVFQISLASPYYFVPVEGEKNKKIFVRKEHLKGAIRYSGNRRGVYKIGTFDTI